MKFSHILLLSILLTSASCASFESEEEPPFVTCPEGPDLELIMISSTSSFNNWVTTAESIEINASTSVSAPFPVDIAGYTLMCDGKVVDTYPEPAITMPATAFGHGAHKLSLYAELIAGESSVRKTIFEDCNLFVFNHLPKITLQATVNGRVTATSTSGEKYEREFTAVSNSEGRIRIPASFFAWAPAKGTAPYLTVELTFQPELKNISDGLTAEISDLQWNVPGNTAISGSVATLKWSNPAAESDWYGLTPSCHVSYHGTYEGIAIDAFHIDGFITLLTDAL